MILWAQSISGRAILRVGILALATRPYLIECFLFVWAAAAEQLLASLTADVPDHQRDQGPG